MKSTKTKKKYYDDFGYDEEEEEEEARQRKKDAKRKKRQLHTEDEGGAQVIAMEGNELGPGAMTSLVNLSRKEEEGEASDEEEKDEDDEDDEFEQIYKSSAAGRAAMGAATDVTVQSMAVCGNGVGSVGEESDTKVAKSRSPGSKRVSFMERDSEGNEIGEGELNIAEQEEQGIKQGWGLTTAFSATATANGSRVDPLRTTAARVCYHFAQTGQCARGAHCRFEHVVSECVMNPQKYTQYDFSNDDEESPDQQQRNNRSAVAEALALAAAAKHSLVRPG